MANKNIKITNNCHRRHLNNIQHITRGILVNKNHITSSVYNSYKEKKRQTLEYNMKYNNNGFPKNTPTMPAAEEKQRTKTINWRVNKKKYMIFLPNDLHTLLYYVQGSRS